MLLTIACVLRSGGIYSPDWVARLHRQAARFAPPHRFVCLSDALVPEVETIRLLHDWPGWWAKLELFRPALFSGTVLYFDLDTILVDDIAALGGFDGGIGLLRDFYRPTGLGSGVMAWNGQEVAQLYHRFASEAGAWFSNPGGDQAFIEAALPGAQRLQDRFPGKIVSYKVDGCAAGPPAGAAVICFHGAPKPHEIGGWVARAWA